MTKLTLTRVALVMILSLTIVESQQNTNVNNWFTKSMDYFHYENCSSQEKSDLTGALYGCLNSKPSGGNSPGDYTHYFKDYMGYMNGMSGGANSLNPSIPDFMNKYNPQNKHSVSNGFQGDKKKPDEDSWAYKTCNELQEILRCMPDIEKTQCLTDDEHKFFSTIKYFFQAQSGYICSNKERISEAFDKSTCKYMKNRADIQQQCFSINAQRLSYDWKVNFNDGVMCGLLKNLKTCEESYYESCEEELRGYIRHSWILPLQVTPCNSSLFEPMIDALSNSRRRKRSTFNNQYGFKTADGNGNQFFKLIPSSYQDQADDTADGYSKSEDLAAMFTGLMSQMQKTGASIVRNKRSPAGYFDYSSQMNNDWASKYNSYSSQGANNKAKDSKTAPASGFGGATGYFDYSSQMNNDWASKYNSYGGAPRGKRSFDDFMGGFAPFGSKSTKKSKKGDAKKDATSDAKTDSKKKSSGFGNPMGYIDYNSQMNNDWASKFNSFGGGSKGDDDKSDSSNPIEKNKKINFDFASKFGPFGRRKRSVFDDLPGMKENKGFSDKFNPNPFTGGSDKDDAKTDADKDSKSKGPVEKNFEINKGFADKFGPFGRRKRSIFDFDLPGMKENKGFSDKFNPNPFTGGSDKSKDDDTADDTADADKDTKSKKKGPVEKNFEINKGFADKFGPFGRRKRSLFDSFGDLPGMKENQGFSQKFNPNPFTGGARKSKDDTETDDADDDSSDEKSGGLDFSRFIPFGNRRKRSLFGGDDDKNPIEKNFEINKKFADKFGGFPFAGPSRKKRSADPYDESTDLDDDDDEVEDGDFDDDDDAIDSDIDDDGDDKKSDLTKKIDKKFSDFFKKKLSDSKKKTEDSTDAPDADDDAKSPFGDLSKFIKKRIDEEQKAKAKKKADEDAAKKADDINLKSTKQDSDYDPKRKSKPQDSDVDDDDDFDDDNSIDSDDDDKKSDTTKELDKKFSDYFKKKIADAKKKKSEKKTAKKTEDSTDAPDADDDDDSKSPFGDLSKIIKKQIEKEQKAKAKKDKDTDSKDDINLKGSKPADDSDDSDDKKVSKKKKSKKTNPWKDLSDFIGERIKEQQKLEAEEKAEKKKKKLAKKKSKSADLTLEATAADATTDVKDDDDKKTDKKKNPFADFLKDLDKYIKDQVKKDLDAEKEKEKAKDDKDGSKKDDKKDDDSGKKLTEREKDELERKKEREEDEKARREERKRDEEERRLERERDEAERKKEREEREKEHEKEHKKSTTTTAAPPAPTTTEEAQTTGAPQAAEPTTTAAPTGEEQPTTSGGAEQSTESTEEPVASTTGSSEIENPTTGSSEIENPTTAKHEKSEEATTEASSDNLDTPTTTVLSSEV